MATIFFTTLGSAIGNIAGFPSVGKFLGGQFGSYISQRIFKSEKFRSTSSSKLDDLFIQSSAYGRVIPICYGQFRFAGNIIWAMPIKEVLSTDLINIGGGGGGLIKGLFTGSYSPGTTLEKKTYNYYANLAIGICEGEVDSLIRIWADNVLLDLTKLNFRFYKGSETQLPDSLISSEMGVLRAPGFRGLCYIVIEDFHINPYGNRIPNFTFEIKRALKDENSVENQIEAINLIPGSGEFVYDTKLIFKKSYNSFRNFDQRNNKFEDLEILDERVECINNASENSLKSDAVLGLDQLEESFTKIKWVNVVVSWFVSGLDLKDLRVYPAVEFNDIVNQDEDGLPEEWNVAGLKRANARVIGRDPQDPMKPNYGGTPSDQSLKRYLAELKKRGFKIMLYPMIFVDKSDKPWRGFISGDASDLEGFFKGVNNSSFKNTFNYFEFILHYAENFRSLIDGIIIGSEFKGITKIFTEKNDNASREFPAVKLLKELALKVRKDAFFDSKEKFIVYASDWSEYHSESGWFFMDDLHSDENIDFVGIDAYFPLTDPDNLSYIPSKDEIKKGFESGEGFDYYYSFNDDGERVRIPFNNPAYAWKNILYWWQSDHFNPDGKKTSWSPRMKKIWFTEFGFPSIHGASNTPNIFFNPDSSTGGIPASSNATINFDLQALCIEAVLEYWKEKNKEFEIIDKMFLWCFDARPYPYYPLDLKRWSDGNLWEPGHWVNGKLGRPSISEILKDLLKRVDFWFLLKKSEKSEDFFVSDLYFQIDGFIAGTSSQSILDLIYSLQDFYPFDIVETDEFGKNLCFSNKANKNVIARLDSEDDLLVFDSENSKEFFKDDIKDSRYSKIKTKINYDDISSSVSLGYFSKENGFEIRVVNFSSDDVEF